MPARYGIQLDDVEGHMPAKYGEDLTGQEITVRMDDGTEVQGHGLRSFEDMTGEDTEGHRVPRIELEVDDTQANLLRAATDKGEPVYVRFPEGAEVRGHGLRLPPRESAEPKPDDAERRGGKIPS